MKPLVQVVPSEVGTNLAWNFFLKRSYWKRGKGGGSMKDYEQSLLQSPQAREDAMVSLQNLRKVFPTTDGFSKIAVDDLNLSMQRNKITGLLGAFLNHQSYLTI